MADNDGRTPAPEPVEPVRARRSYDSSSPVPFGAARGPGPLVRFPLVDDLLHRRVHGIRTDVMAGIGIAALAVPQAMGYAQTAGLPVVAGLYGLLLPLVAYAALGSSRVLMTGPTATAALLVLPAVAVVSDDPADYPVLAAMLALLVAAVFLVGRALRLGWISDYFSSAVMLGFLTGLALTLASGQIGVLVGVPVEGDTPLQEYASFFSNLIGGIDWPTAIVGFVSLAALLIGGRFLPRFPTLLAVTVLAILASWALALGDAGVTLVGEIPAGLPSLQWPSVSLVDALAMLPSALGIALVGFSDAILAARSLSKPEDPPVDANQEMVALAGVNLMAGLSQSMPLGSSGSRSAVNVRLGGRSQIVGLVQVAAVVLVLLFLTGALALLPKATLAAVIIYAAIGLVDVGGWKALARGSRGELLVAVVTVLGMVAVGLLAALVLAVLLSVIDVVRRSAEPRDAVLGWSPRHGRFVNVERRGGAARVVPGVVVYRLDDRLFFANTGYFTGRMRDAVSAAPYAVDAVVFDAEAVTNLDASGAQAIREMHDELDRQGIRFVLARSRVQFESQIDRLGLDDVLPEAERFPTVRAAVLAVSGVDVEAELPVEPQT